VNVHHQMQRWTCRRVYEDFPMNIVGYEAGPIVCKAAFTSDFDLAPGLPLQQVVTNLAVGQKRMGVRPGMRHKYTPLRFDPATGLRQLGGIAQVPGADAAKERVWFNRGFGIHGLAFQTVLRAHARSQDIRSLQLEPFPVVTMVATRGGRCHRVSNFSCSPAAATGHTGYGDQNVVLTLGTALVRRLRPRPCAGVRRSSAAGQQATSAGNWARSALPPTTDIGDCCTDVR
jgi:hypothetical protein